MSAVQVVALFLALCGVLWGLVILLVAAGLGGTSPTMVFVFSPGYLVTLGYIIRAICTPPFILRCAIWALSVVVQAAWLVLVGLSDFNLGTIWWSLATSASAWALWQEIQDEDFGSE